MVYNAYSYGFAFKSVDKIIITDKTGEQFVLDDILCNPDNVNEEQKFMRQGGAAIAVLKNIVEAVKIEVFVSKKYCGDNSKIRISDLKILAEKC